MKPLDWVPQLAIGNPTVDTQHQRLFAIYNLASSLDEKDLDKTALLQELVDYAGYHFADEEQLMKEIRYPEKDLAIHKKLHGHFLDTLGSLKGRPVYETLDFFREWLLQHIFLVDRKVGQFMKDHPPGQMVLGSADIFTFAFQDNPAAMTLTDMTTNTMVDVNKAFEKVTGRPRSDFVGRGPESVNVWADLEDRKRMFEILESGREYQSEEMRFLNREGELRLGLASGKFIRVGGRKCLLLLFIDTTEKSRAEKAVFEFQSRFEAVFRFSPMAMIISDPADGTILDTNLAMEALSGFTRTEMVGKTSVDLGFWESTHVRNDLVHLVQTDRIVRAKELKFLNRSGQSLWTRCSFRLLEWDHRPCMLTSLEDISAEKELVQAKKLDALGKLAGTIAHDFNNILAGILGNLDLIHLQSPPGPLVEKRLETVQKGALRARDLVRQILVFSRKKEKEEEPVDLAPLVREVVGLLRDTFPGTVEFSAEITVNTLPVMADPTQLHQVLMNLGTNAAQALKGGPGKVFFRLRPGSGGARVDLSVEDNGPGIDPRVRPRIFDPFFTTKAPGEGTGLGLAAVQRIVTNHGGTLAVESTVGKGTAFQITFPGTGLPAFVHSGPGAALPRGKLERILLVEDDLVLLDSTAGLLEILGYQVSRHPGTDGALAEFAAGDPGFDLVFTDLTMPGTDGIGFVEQLQALRPGVRVLLASGYLASGSSVLFRSLGIAGYLAKPYQVTELARAVRTVLDSQN